MRQPLLPGELGHRRALVLGDVAEAEGQLALLAEALRPHLVGADAGGDRQQVVLQRHLHDGRRQVDVAGREDDLRPLGDELVRARRRDGAVVSLRVAGLDHQLVAEDAPLLVDLGDPDLRRRERRRVEGLHRALAVVGPADDDRLLRRRRMGASGRGRGEDERRSGDEGERPARPRASGHVSPLRTTACAVTLRCDQHRSNASRPRRASSAGPSAQSESGYALPNAPSSEKISRS